MRMTFWDPFKTFEEMERLMDSFFSSPKPTYPPIDMIDQTDRILIKAELPGVDKDSLDLTILDNTLTISGEKKLPGENLSYVRHERPHGKFRRHIDLPYSVAADKVEAKYKDGILTVILPKAEEANPRKINIE